MIKVTTVAKLAFNIGVTLGMALAKAKKQQNKEYQKYLYDLMESLKKHI